MRHSPQKTLIALLVLSYLGTEGAYASATENDAVDQQTTVGQPQKLNADTTDTTAVYTDRVMSQEQQQKIQKEDVLIEPNYNGRLRNMNIELLLSNSERGQETFKEQGIKVNGSYTTDDFGVFSINASYSTDQTNRPDRNTTNNSFFRKPRSNSGGTFTIWQRNFYLNEHWVMNNGLGVLNTNSTQLTQDQYRFFLPSFTILGVSNDTTRTDGRIQTNFSYGKNGFYNGYRTPRFETSDGQAFSAGAQYKINNNWTVASTIVGTDNQLIADYDGYAQLVNGKSKSVHVAAAYEKTNAKYQFNVLNSEFVDTNAHGAWFDGYNRKGSFDHNYGLFYLQDNLSWGALPINSNALGGYYRMNYNYGRLNVGLGVDSIDSLNNNGFKGDYYTSYFRYQKSLTVGLGGYLNYRKGAVNETYSSSVFVDRRGDLGNTRFQVERMETTGRYNDREDRFSVDHGWKLKGSTSLNTSLSYSQRHIGSEDTSGWTAAINGSKSLTNNIKIDGMIRTVRETGNGAIHSTDANIGVNWRINNNWSVNGYFYQNEGKQRREWVIDPLAPPDLFWRIPKDRSVFVSVRYTMSAGRRTGVIGAPAGAPAGQISGVVFMDENKDNTYNASERGIPNVTVILDGLYTTQTDSEGRYELPNTFVGKHTIKTVNDSLPLPWNASEHSIDVTVPLRDEVRVNIPAVRN